MGNATPLCARVRAPSSAPRAVRTAQEQNKHARESSTHSSSAIRQSHRCSTGARRAQRRESSVETQTDLSLEISSLELVDTHEHLLPEDQWAGDNARLIEGMREAGEPGWGDASPDILQDLFLNYVPSDLEVAGASREAIAQLFDPAAGDIEFRFSGIRAAWEATQFTGYGEAVRLIAREVYGLDSLTAEGLEGAQSKLEELRQPGERLRLLSEVAGLDHVQIDNFQWACKPDESGPDFFLYDLSWAGFARGDVKVEDIYQETGIEVSTLEDLREALAAIFRRYAPCAIAVKAQHAYTRTLRWEERSDEDAAEALAVVLAGGEVEEATRLTLGDWCWARGVELAIEYSIQARRGLQRALEAEIASGDLTETEAITIAHRLMHDNQYACFDIEGARAAIRAQLAPAEVA